MGGTRQSGLCRVPAQKALGKDDFQKKKIVECLTLALGKISFKKLKKNFCRVPKVYTRQNKFLKIIIKKFAECHPLGTRQSLTADARRHGPATFCRVGLLPSAAALGKA